MILELVMESIFAVVDIFLLASSGLPLLLPLGLLKHICFIVLTSNGARHCCYCNHCAKSGRERKWKMPVPCSTIYFSKCFVFYSFAIAGIFLCKTYSPSWAQMHGASSTAIAHPMDAWWKRSDRFVIRDHAIFRGAGDAAIACEYYGSPMDNILLDPLFGFWMGTIPPLALKMQVCHTTAAGIAVLIQLWTLLPRRKTHPRNFSQFIGR